MIGIVEAAQRMGYYAIVIDNSSSGLTKWYADKSYDFNPSNTAILAKVAADEDVAGIFTAIDDSTMWHAIKLCKTAGIPMFASQEQMDMEEAKAKFLEICENFNVPVVQEQEFTEGMEPLHPATSAAVRPSAFVHLGNADAKHQLESPHKVKLYYTLHHKYYWGNRRTRLFIKAPGRRSRRSAAIYASTENKAVREQVLQ